MANYNSDQIEALESQPAVYPGVGKSGPAVMQHDQASITGGDAVGTTITFFQRGMFQNGQFIDLRKSTVRFPAMGASVTLNIGTPTDPTAFKANVDVSSAGETSLFTSGDPFYSVNEPLENGFQIVGTISGDAVGSGSKTLYVDLTTFRPA